MPELQQLAQSKERKLESWGEIAAYLRREIRTVQRWEKTLGLPIRRLQVGKQSSVYAFPSELDKWYLEREPQVKEEERSDEHTPTAPPELRPAFPIQAIDEKASQEIPFYKKKSTWFGGMAFLVILVLLIARSVPWPPSGMFRERPSRRTGKYACSFARFRTSAAIRANPNSPRA
jgi:hypothetical protein